MQYYIWRGSTAGLIVGWFSSALNASSSEESKLALGRVFPFSDNLHSDSHTAIMLVSADLLERGLILDSCEVDAKTN